MPNDFEITMTDNTGLIMQHLNQNVMNCLEEIGQRAEDYAKMKCPRGTPETTNIQGYHTQGLKESITHKVVESEKAVYIGTNKKSKDGHPYPVYVELGTGIYATDGKGRRSPWVWVDENGKPHRTHGMQPKHMIRDSLADHISEYKRVIQRYMGE